MGEHFGDMAQQFLQDGWVFRGQTDSAYSLLPTALREDTDFFASEIGRWEASPRRLSVDVDARKQAQVELYTLRRFYLLSDQHGLPIPGDTQQMRADMLHPWEYLNRLQHEARPWPPPELLSFMALAQHHGLPTRLLDWTRNIDVATYFASVGAARAYTELVKARTYGVTSKDRSHRDDGKMGVWALDLYAATQGERPALVTVTAPTAGNPNLHAQEGLFTVTDPARFDWATKADYTPLDQLLARATGQQTTPSLYHFTLPIRHAPHLFTLLTRERIAAARNSSPATTG